MLRFHLKACPKCHGDLALDEGDWICLQCGTYYYTRLYTRLYQKPAPSPFPETSSQIDVTDRATDRREKEVALLTSTATQARHVGVGAGEWYSICTSST